MPPGSLREVRESFASLAVLSSKQREHSSERSWRDLKTAEPPLLRPRVNLSPKLSPSSLVWVGESSP